MSTEIIDILSSDEDENAQSFADDSVQPTYVKLETTPKVLLIEDSPNKNSIFISPNGSTGDSPRKSTQGSNLDSTDRQASPVLKPPEDLAESRRRKIDTLLNNFERAQYRLQTVESMMDAAQRLRWDRLCNSCVKDQSDSGINNTSPMDYNNRSPSPSASAPHRSMPMGPMSIGHSSSGPSFQRPPWFIDPPGGGYSGSTSRAGGGGAVSSYSSRRATTSASTSRTPFKRRYKKKRATRRSTTSTTTKRAPRVSSTSKRSSTTPSSVDRKPKISTAVRVKVKREC